MSKTKQKNYRLPEYTIKQIEFLIQQTGATETQIIILAVERLAQSQPTIKKQQKPR